MSLPVSLGVGLLLLLGVGGYLYAGLPRLSLWAAAAVTACAGAVLLLIASLSGSGVILPLLGVVSLVSGHAGWLLGRRTQAEVKALRRRRGRQRATLGGEPKARPSGPTRRAGGATEAPAVAIDILPTPVPHHGVTQPISAAVSAELGVATPESPEALKRQESPIAPPGQGLAMADLHRTSLGRYRIDRAIGRGSMGAVYLGHDPMLGRQVAIKTMALGREFDGAELQETKQRFFREAETAGRLQHRDIVTIYDVGEEQDLAYIAMEFLKGHDLQRHTQPSHLLPVPVVLRLAGRVAEALAYAHSQGVVHRDIKPANVMIHLPTGAVKVTDFGIARVTDATRTRTGMVLGTPSFMSPEHLAGLSVDGRSDLYSLGVMLFQLLTGQLPFQAESMAKLMYKIANEPAADIRSLRPELPAALGEVIGRLLQKNPATRPPDGQVLAAELRAIEQGLGPPSGEGLLESAPAPGTGPASGDAYASTVRFARNQTGHN